VLWATRARPARRRHFLTSHDHRRRREHSVEAGCRAAEDLVANERTAVVGYHVLAATGILVVLFAAPGVFGESVLLRLVLTALAGRVLGQRQVVRWWRTSLERPMSTEDPAA
jgi:hypothetical protein